MGEPRWLDVAAAAAYLSLRPEAFARKVRAGIIPQPSARLGERTPRWDRDTLDASMGAGPDATSAREAVNALATQIAAKGRADGAARAQGRHGQGLHVQPPRAAKGPGRAGG